MAASDMNDPKTWALVRLENLGQMESECRESAWKSRLMANRYRAVSAGSSTLAEIIADPPVKQMCEFEAKYFAGRAEMEEGFAESGLQRAAEINDLKRRMLIFLGRLEARGPAAKGGGIH